MLLRIQNIGPIGSAHIDLTGLTIIGGLNDTGKSTIGKCLFAIVKAIRNREEEFVAGQRNKITAVTSELISELRGLIGPSVSPSIFNNILRRLQDIRRFTGEEGMAFFDATGENIKSSILTEIRRRTYIVRHPSQSELEFPSEDEESLRHVLRNDVIDNALRKIRQIIAEKQDAQATYSASFKNMLSSIFRGEINNKRLPNEGCVILSDTGEDIFSAAFTNNILADSSLQIQDSVISALFEDATLIESPFILNFEEDLILIPRSSSGEYSGAYTTYDLMEKLNFASKEVEPNSPLEREITEKISQTIGGKMYYESEDDKFIFSSNDNFDVRITNTASGIKTLGIIQMLARAGVLNTSNLLIIDEPEVHLHPAWQILYAEIVAILVKNNVYCVISSHSPYFIQALEAYSKLYKIDNLTKFYKSTKENGLCNFSDVTADTEPLYKLLADPMKEIAFLRARAQNE